MNKIKVLLIIYLLLFSGLLYSQSNSLIEAMIAASAIGNEEEVIQIKSNIEAVTKPIKGDRKIARALNDKGLFELNAGNFDSAVVILKTAFETDQADTEIASNLGYALVKSGKINEAQAPFNHSIMLNPNRAAAWANLSEVYANKGDLKSATAILNIAYLLSTNKEKTNVYFQKYLIDDQKNPILVTAAKEALKDQGIKPVLEYEITGQQVSTNINNEKNEVAIDTKKESRPQELPL